MSKKKTEEKKKSKPKIIDIEASPKLVLSAELMNLFNYFHHKVGKKEWSGILFYTVEGSVRDIDSLEFRAEHMMLKDIGTAASTGYEFDEDVLDYFESNPETEDMKMGMIHTHHDMNNYFSSTDMGELQDNAPNHNYYLSLIASFDCKYSAKLAIYAKSKDATVVIKDEEGKEIEQVIAGADLIYVADCQIVFELDSYNIKAMKDLEEKAKKKANKSYATGYGGHQGTLYPVKQGGSNSKKNPLADKQQVASAITGVLYCDPFGQDISNINPALAFKRMDEVLDPSEVSQYIDGIEDFMGDVISVRFGGSDLDIEEFADAAIAYLDTLGIEDNPVYDTFIEMLKFHSSEYDVIDEEEELIII